MEKKELQANDEHGGRSEPEHNNSGITSDKVYHSDVHIRLCGVQHPVLCARSAQFI